MPLVNLACGPLPPAGLDINVRNEDGATPLHAAARNGRLEVRCSARHNFGFVSMNYMKHVSFGCIGHDRHRHLIGGSRLGCTCGQGPFKDLADSSLPPLCPCMHRPSRCECRGAKGLVADACYCADQGCHGAECATHDPPPTTSGIS